MLESMRKHMTWMMWLIVGLITVTFLFFGIYPSSVGGGTVAKVGGYVITSDEVNRVYRNMYDNYREILKDKFDESMAKRLKAQAIQDLIVNRLLVQEAERVGLHVTDEELQASIVRIPAFGKEGKFDKKTYEWYLDRVNITPSQFEVSQREYLLRQKLERLVEAGVDLMDSELASAYAARNPKAKPADFEKKKADFKRSYLAQKRQEAVAAFVKGIRDRTPIDMNEKALAL